MENQSIVLTPVPIGDLISAISADVLSKLTPLLPPVPPSSTSIGRHNEDPYITRKEAAKLLRVSLVTLHKYTVAGMVKAYRINGGRQVRFIETEVREAFKRIQTV